MGRHTSWEWKILLPYLNIVSREESPGGSPGLLWESQCIKPCLSTVRLMASSGMSVAHSLWHHPVTYKMKSCSLEPLPWHSGPSIICPVLIFLLCPHTFSVRNSLPNQSMALPMQDKKALPTPRTLTCMDPGCLAQFLLLSVFLSDCGVPRATALQSIQLPPFNS